MDQRRVVLEHLLEMRDAPILRRRVTEEAPFDVVVRATAGHLLERVHGHAPELGVRAQHRLFEQQQDRIGLRKLRRVAEATVFGVVCGLHGVEDRVHEARLELAHASRDTRRRTLARLEDSACDVGLVRSVVVRDADQRARHLVRRQVGAAREDVARSGEECGGRPAAHVVALVDVGPDVVVDTHRHVLAVDDVDHAGMRVRRLVHHVAPVAPHGRDRKQNRTTCVAGLVESLWRPGMPVDFRGAVRPRREVKLLRCLAHRDKVTMAR